MYTRDSASCDARKAHGKPRPFIVAPTVALAAAVALPLAAAPLAAQRTIESARTTCDSCDMEDSLAAVQREYERVRSEYRRIASKAMRQRMEEMRARMEASREQQRSALSRLRSFATAPSGWLGLTFSGSYTVRQHDGEKAVMRFEDYPTVEAVDPGSPAEKAGIKAGDKLLSLDGHDLTQGSPPFSELLRPGAKLDAKVKRDDRTRNVTIRVGKRPNNYASSWGDWEMTIAPTPAPPAAPEPDWPAVAPMPALPPTVSVSAMPSMRELAPAMGGWTLSSSGSPTMLTGFSGGIIAGAQVQRVKELSDYFDVDDGLLVLHVIPGTPAERAGLRPGDVIRRADDRTITTPTSLQRALAASDSRELRLDIVRKGKSRSVELKWDN
jgi:C-terminal processing protease CtpA/Prc